MQEKDPLVTSPDSSESDYEKLLQQAYADDAADESGEQPSSAPQDGEGTAQPKSEDRATDPAEDKAQPDNPEPSADPKDGDRPRGPDGKFLPKDAAPPPPQADPNESKFARAKKDEARLARNRQEFEEEKARYRQEQEQIKREWAEFKQQHAAQSQSRNGDVGKFDSQSFNRAYLEFRDKAHRLLKEGDIDGAIEQFNWADKAQQGAQEAYQAEQQEQQSKFVNEWQNKAREVIKERPTLGDASHEDARAMGELLTQYPVLGMIPDGFKHAAEILTMRKDAAEASGLREENNKLKAEIERLTKLTTPAGGKDAAKAHSSGIRPEDMPLHELHMKLKNEAEMADAA
jgi:hypothetical protein